jgi:hypothetical protein
MAKRGVIWKAGERWRDLTDDVAGAGGHRSHNTPLWWVVAGFVYERCWPEIRLGAGVGATVESGSWPIVPGHLQLTPGLPA